MLVDANIGVWLGSVATTPTVGGGVKLNAILL